jgi:hypothetical protein
MSEIKEMSFRRTHICDISPRRPKAEPKRFPPVNGGMELSDDLDYRYLLCVGGRLVQSSHGSCSIPQTPTWVRRKAR